MLTKDELPSNTNDVLISLVQHLRVEIEKRGLPYDVLDAVRNLESKIIDYCNTRSEENLLMVDSNLNKVILIFRQLMAQPELQSFIKSFGIKLLIEIFQEVIKLL